MKLAIATLALLGLAVPAQAGDLIIDVSSQRTGGAVAVAVYRDASAFKRGERAVATQSAPRSGAVTTVTILGLPPGRYAVAAFHDLDGNGDLTLWPFGVPKEAYGFSRDARGRLGPPAFDAAAFDLSDRGTREAVTLR